MSVYLRISILLCAFITFYSSGHPKEAQKIPYLFTGSFYSTNFNYDTNSLYSSLKSGGLILPVEYRQIFIEAFKSRDLPFDPDKQSLIIWTNSGNIDECLSNDINAVSLLPWNMVKPWERALRWNGALPWDRTNSLQPYSLMLPGRPDDPLFLREEVTVIAAGGTVVLSRGIMRLIERTSDVDAPWKGIGSIFMEADASFVNLKSPLVDRYIPGTNLLRLYGKSGYAAGLSNAHISAVSISGNHIGDAGDEGISNTMEALSHNGILYSGAGTGPDEACGGVFFEANNLKIGFIGVNWNPSTARTASKSGVFGISRLSQEFLEYVKKAKSVSDFLIVLPNWGWEYRTKPIAQQVYWGRRLVESGADIVIGDQAHWVQNSAFYRGKFISYCLGNLVFDQLEHRETREGVIEKFIVYGKNLMQIEIIPVYLGRDKIVRPADDPAVMGSIFSKVLNYR
ncbi:MAG: CapA family protein [Brevinematales bacterium]